MTCITIVIFSRDTIQRQHVDGTGRETVLSGEKNGPLALGSCEGLAVDWIGRALYWTDEALGTISAAPLAAMDKRKTIVRDMLMSSPRAIALHPVKG